MNFKISQEANRDIENIWLYTYENWSLEQADRYFNLIIDEIEYLTKNPESGKNYNQIRKGYYRSRIKSHVIFYKINLKAKQIEIIRVLHQRMDIDSQLNE
ncbi:MAG: type II toxin-antitoxin system RelE/ParE family toxin [Flavobacteriaceae bacterium]|nr:type II toxin-antitoxin system RelE/ParE family toxin [Flavobacteriaceae bacterium]